MIHDMLNRECTIERRQDSGLDSDYLPQPDYQPISSDTYAYALQEKNGIFKANDGQGLREIAFTAVAYFPFDTDIKSRVADSGEKRDRIVDSVTGATYYVNAVLDQVGHEEFLKVLLSDQ